MAARVRRLAPNKDQAVFAVRQSDLEAFSQTAWRTKKVDIKHRAFQVRYAKPVIVDLNKLNASFQDGDLVSPKVLIKKGVIKSYKKGVKVLSEGELTKKLNFSGLKFSKSAQEKILKAGGTIK